MNRRPMNDMKPGDRIGEWTLIEYKPSHVIEGTTKREVARWRCRCSCGVVRDVEAATLYRTHKKPSMSCGGPPHGNASWFKKQPLRGRVASVFELGTLAEKQHETAEH